MTGQALLAVEIVSVNNNELFQRNRQLRGDLNRAHRILSTVSIGYDVIVEEEEICETHSTIKSLVR